MGGFSSGRLPVLQEIRRVHPAELVAAQRWVSKLLDQIGRLGRIWLLLNWGGGGRLTPKLQAAQDAERSTSMRHRGPVALASRWSPVSKLAPRASASAT
jgi:hypothetical protein